MLKGYKRSQENKFNGSFVNYVKDSTNSEDSPRRIYDQFTKIDRIPSERFIHLTISEEDPTFSLASLLYIVFSLLACFWCRYQFNN